MTASGADAQPQHQLPMNELLAALLRASQHRFIGRLARDPEVRFFQSGSCVASARIAVNKPGAKKDDGQEPDWFKVEIWGDAGQAFADQCKKGQLVDVTGRVKSESWTDQSSGEIRTQLAITADEWRPVGQPPAPTPAKAPPAVAAPTWLSSDTTPISDAELPF